MGVERSIDISGEQREAILTLLERHLPGTAAWVYGSRTKWTSRPQSDLDLVVFSTPEQRVQVGALRDAFEESGLPFRVDLFVWDDVPDAFHEKIQTEHVELVPKPTAKAQADWRETRWGDIATLEYGRALRGYDSAQGPFRVFGTNGPIGWHDQALCEHASVIVGRKGAYRGIHYSADPFFVIDTAFYLKPKVEMDTRWAYYTLLTQDINGMDSGSAIPSTSREDFYTLPVSVPPPPEQRAIVHILGTLDDKIELNRRTNETLEAMARALFKSWFVDFDPVRAKMEGRDPYLDAEIWDLFPDTLNKEGEPEGWRPTELGDRVEILDAKRIPLSSRERQKRQGPFPYHGAAGVLDHIDDYLFDGVHVLLGEDGSVIRADGTPFTQYVWGKFWVNNHAHVLKGKSISNEMLFCFLEQVYIAPFVTGAVQPKLNQKNLKSVPFPPADSRIAAFFRRATEPLFARLRINTEQSQSLTVLRDTLLPKLISGDLRLREAERMAGTVA